MDKAHSEYLKVMPYTVNETKDANHLINLKVDGLITDIPDKL